MKRTLTLCAAALLLCLGQAQAQTQTLAPNANLKADGIPPISMDLVQRVAPYTEFRAFGFVDWHPLRREMLVRHRAAGENIAQLFLLKTPGGPLEKVTNFADPVGSASFNPVDGSYLVYARAAGGSEAEQIYRLDLASGASTLLSSTDERSSATWSRKGDRILIASVPLDRTAKEGKREEIATTIALVDPLQVAPRRVLASLPGGGWGDFRFSPDDTRLAALQYRTPSDSDVWLMDTATGTRERVLPLPGQGPAGFGDIRWSMDQRSLFLTTNTGGEFFQLARYDITSKTLTMLSAHIPWDVQSISPSRDGKYLLAEVNNNGRDEARLFDAQSGKELARPELGIGALGGLSWHKSLHGTLAYSLNSPQSPGDVFSFDVATGRTERWTQAFFAPGVDPQNFISPELVQIKSFDGLPISGWLYLPDARKFPGKRPVVVDFHGGPEGQSTVHFMGRWNYYLNELGLAIFLPNVRGSTGFGKSFLNLDNGFLRKDSVKDGGAFLDWLATHPRINGTRMAVTGGSYGGYMSLAMAVDYSAKLRGAIDVVGISNFVSFLNNTESYRRDLRRVEYGDERDPAMRAFHEKIAPLNNASNIRIPLLVVHGKNDPRVPYTEAEQIVSAVRKNGIDVWYLLADNEGHGFARKSNADFYFYSSALFLENVLLK